MADEVMRLVLNGSFLYNAGVIGMLRLLEYMQARLGEDYGEQGRTLWIRRHTLAKANLAEAFVGVVAAWLGQDTGLSRALAQKEHTAELFAQCSAQDSHLARQQLETLLERMRVVVNRRSFLSGCAILADGGFPVDLRELSAQYTKAPCLKSKVLAYHTLCEGMEDSRAQRILLFKEIMYTRINLFYDKVSFFLPARLGIDPAVCYQRDFEQPLKRQLDGQSSGKKRCIECGGVAVMPRSAAFMRDTAEDVARKKSGYWNQRPDAYVCPLCAVLYTLAPLGFAFLGREAVFFNGGCGVRHLADMMDTLVIKHRAAGGQTGGMFVLLSADALVRAAQSLQVVIRRPQDSHYTITVLDRAVLSTVCRGARYLSAMSNQSGFSPAGSLTLFDEATGNLIARRSQYPLVDRLIRADACGAKSIYGVVMLEILSRGGDHMDDLKRSVNIAWSCGKSMRTMMTASMSEKERDARLKSMVHRLSNFLSVGSREDFLDVIVRTYSGRGLSVPSIFKNCYDDYDTFRAIGYGYILGLKHADRTRPNKDRVDRTPVQADH